MAKKKAAQAAVSLKKTRSKIQTSPFKSVTELNKASDGIRHEQWTRLEAARIANELINTEQFAIIKKELETGISCNFGSAQGDLVKVFSEGMGIQISLNKELFSEVNAPDHAESVIRAVADTFSKSYLAIKGLTPLHKPSTDSKRATPSKGEKS
jgi:hypothetical protein